MPRSFMYQPFGKARRMTAVLAAAAAGVLLLSTGSAVAQSYRGMSCGQLWYARNAIYASKGYCFETQQAIRVLGRACFPPFGRLNRAEQREVETIRAWERRKGCR